MLSSPIVLKAAPLVKKTQDLLKALSHSLIVSPHLVVIILGQHEPSWIYVRQKQKIALQLGLAVSVLALEGHTDQSTLNTLCKKYSADPQCHGILIQLPLPVGLNIQEALRHVDPAKDIDGLTLTNQSFIGTQESHRGFTPCTPLGVMRLLQYYGIILKSQRVLVIGRSPLVGRPMALCALERDATISIAHSKTLNLKELAKQCDIIISATGELNLIQWADCQEHQIIVDVGMHRDPHAKLHGDFGPILTPPQVRAYTPVPGGVGPMTINTLMYNVFQAYFRQTGQDWSSTQMQIDSLTHTEAFNLL